MAWSWLGHGLVTSVTQANPLGWPPSNQGSYEKSSWEVLEQSSEQSSWKVLKQSPEQSPELTNAKPQSIATLSDPLLSLTLYPL